MKAKEIIKKVASAITIDQDSIERILDYCEHCLPGYSNYFWKLYSEAQETPDDECINLSRQGELHYLITQSPRICAVVKSIQEIVGVKGSRLRVLDIGATQFTKLYKNFLDLDVTALDRTDFLRNRFLSDGIEFICHDFMKGIDIPADNDQFDVCIFTEVFEHMVAPPKNIFRPLRRILKSGSELIFSTPNIARFDNRLRLLRGRPILDPIDWVLRDDFDDESPHGLGHIREYTLEELVAIVSKYGFRTTKGMFPVDSNFVLDQSLKGRFVRHLYKMVHSIGPHCQVVATLEK